MVRKEGKEAAEAQRRAERELGRIAIGAAGPDDAFTPRISA
jgi:hypothetical protein